jgi:shikimate kinase
VRLALIGPRAAGKSTVAPRLARALGLPCFDLDQQVVQATGESIQSLVDRAGWTAFRRAELTAFDNLPSGPMVLAVGAGFPTQEGAIERLARFDDRLWLDLEPNTQIARRTHDPRPSLGDANLRTEITRLHAERHAVYAGLASARIDAAAPLDAVLLACTAALETL